MSLCSWSAYDMHIQMAQIPFTSFTLQVLHAGIKSINVSVHACQCRHHNRHSESVQCTVTILFVSVTITYRHSESVQCSHHHVCQCQHHRQALSQFSAQSPPTFSAKFLRSFSRTYTNGRTTLKSPSLKKKTNRFHVGKMMNMTSKKKFLTTLGTTLNTELSIQRQLPSVADIIMLTMLRFLKQRQTPASSKEQ